MGRRVAPLPSSGECGASPPSARPLPPPPRAAPGVGAGRRGGHPGSRTAAAAGRAAAGRRRAPSRRRCGRGEPQAVGCARAPWRCQLCAAPARKGKIPNPSPTPRLCALGRSAEALGGQLPEVVLLSQHRLPRVRGPQQLRPREGPRRGGRAELLPLPPGRVAGTRRGPEPLPPVVPPRPAPGVAHRLSWECRGRGSGGRGVTKSLVVVVTYDLIEAGSKLLRMAASDRHRTEAS